MSACGIKFTTNQFLKPDSYFLIYLNDQLLDHISHESQSWFNLGDYFLSKVIWIQELDTHHFEVGAGFLERKECGKQDLETFTELVNLEMLDSLPDLMSYN